MSVKYGFSAKQIIQEGRVTQNSIDNLREWLKLQGLPKLTDEQIVLFLLCCDELEDTKQTILNFYEARKGSPELFDSRNLNQEDLQKQLEVLEFNAFPKWTPDGNAILFHRLYDSYYSNYKMQPAMKLFFMALDSAIYDRPPNGLIILFDMKGVGLLHLTTIKLHLIKVFFRYLQECVPVKVKAVHVLNSVYFIDKLMAIIKPFINAELLSLVHFHSSSMNMDDFYEKYLPKQCLPVEFGGDLPSVRILQDEMKEKLTQMQDYFDAEEQQRRELLP